MQIKKDGMQIEFCCKKMQTGVLGRTVDIRTAKLSLAKDKNRMVFPEVSGEHAFIKYCPYCSAEIIFKTFK